MFADPGGEALGFGGFEHFGQVIGNWHGRSPEMTSSA
jgi:hypothetical protein